MPEKFIPYNALTDEQKALVDSEEYFDRAMSAVNGYGLDKLVDDSDPHILRIVIALDYGLDKLAQHPHEDVRDNVTRFLEKFHSQTIEEWIAANPDRCVLPENRTQAASAQKQTSKTVDIPQAKTQAAAHTSLNQDAMQWRNLLLRPKQSTQDLKQVK